VRIFWSFIALLVVATVVVFVVESSDGHRAQPTLSQKNKTLTPALSQGERGLEKTLSPTLSQREREQESPLARRERTDHEHQVGTQNATAPSSDFLAFLGFTQNTGVAEVSAEQRAKDEASRKARISPLPDGGVEVDERFTIRGKGNEREPYTVPWELLMSAQEVYVPREGREVIPGRISMLEGTRVKIEGYVMLPMVRDDVREFVVMQSQWDGCCIGIPPTPYDSIEVSLAEPIDFGFGMRQSATVTGRMVVDPYVFGAGTLLGLYTIEDAKIEVTEW